MTNSENLDDKSIEARSLVITVFSGFRNLALTSNVIPLATAIVTSSNDNVLISIFLFCYRFSPNTDNYHTHVATRR